MRVIGGILGVLSLACCGAACGGAQSGEEGDSPPPQTNLLLITIDTLRPDRLGCYGYERDTSPHLDRFREQCVLFENAFSTSSFTPPSHASLMTSRLPRDHGLLTWNPMPDDQRTLAEVLAKHGYRTGASVNLSLLSEQNLGQGFEWQREAQQTRSRPGSQVLKQASTFLDADDGRPWFLWLHFYDVHRPYGGPAEWKQRFGEHDRSGFGDHPLKHYSLGPEELAEFELDAEDLAYVDNRYDAGIAYLDDLLGPLLDDFSAEPRRSDTLVVVTSDHGENLLEERGIYFTHDPYLQKQVTRIPLLVRLPNGAHAGASSDALVSLIDVAPTVLDALQVRAPKVFHGASALASLDGEPWSRDAIFMETWGHSTLKAARSGDALVVHDIDLGQSQYYDLASDPDEMNPASEPTTNALRKLAEQLDAFLPGDGAHAAEPEIDEGLKERLEQLGYGG